VISIEVHGIGSMDSIDRNLWVVLLENASLWNYKAYAANQPALIHIHIIAIVLIRV
jgi:hypothetical protein